MTLYVIVSHEDPTLDPTAAHRVRVSFPVAGAHRDPDAAERAAGEDEVVVALDVEMSELL